MVVLGATQPARNAWSEVGSGFLRIYSWISWKLGVGEEGSCSLVLVEVLVEMNHGGENVALEGIGIYNQIHSSKEYSE